MLISREKGDGDLEPGVGKSMRDAKIPMQTLLLTCEIALLFLFFVPGIVMQAQQDKWIELGWGTASRASSSAYIPADASRGTVCQIRFAVQTSQLDLEQVIVHFSNSQSMRVASVQTLMPNSISTAIPLPGIRRSVAGVDILYKLHSPGAPAPVLKLSGNVLSGDDVCPR
jgi:hypothetical protein